MHLKFPNEYLFNSVGKTCFVNVDRASSGNLTSERNCVESAKKKINLDEKHEVRTKKYLFEILQFSLIGN